MSRKRIYITVDGEEVSRVVNFTPAEEAARDAPFVEPDKDSDILLALRDLADAIGPDAVAKFEARLGNRLP